MSTQDDTNIQTNNSNILNQEQEEIEQKLIDKKRLIEILSSVIILIAAALQGLGESMQSYVQSGAMSEDEAKQSLMKEINDRNINISRLVQSGGAGELAAVQKYQANQALEAPVTDVTGAADTVNALFEIGKLTKNVAGATIGKIASESYELAKNLLGVALTKLEESVLGVELANLPGDTTAQKLNNLSALVNEIAQDPEAREALKNLSKSLANLGIETLEATQPQLDELTEKFWTVANGIASKSAVSAVTVATSAVMAVIADIPVIGGIVVDMFLAAKTFNNLAETAGYSIQKSSEVFKKGVETLGTAAGVVSDNAAPVISAVQNAQEALSNTLERASNLQVPQVSLPQVPQVSLPQYKVPEVSVPGIPIYNKSGGSTVKAIEKVNSIKKRIRKTVKAFKGKSDNKQNKNKKKSKKKSNKN